MKSLLRRGFLAFAVLTSGCLTGGDAGRRAVQALNDLPGQPRTVRLETGLECRVPEGPVAPADAKRYVALRELALADRPVADKLAALRADRPALATMENVLFDACLAAGAGKIPTERYEELMLTALDELYGVHDAACRRLAREGRRVRLELAASFRGQPADVEVRDAAGRLLCPHTPCAVHLDRGGDLSVYVGRFQGEPDRPVCPIPNTDARYLPSRVTLDSAAAERSACHAAKVELPPAFVCPAFCGGSGLTPEQQIACQRAQPATPRADAPLGEGLRARDVDCLDADRVLLSSLEADIDRPALTVALGVEGGEVCGDGVAAERAQQIAAGWPQEFAGVFWRQGVQWCRDIRQACVPATWFLSSEYYWYFYPSARRAAVERAKALLTGVLAERAGRERFARLAAGLSKTLGKQKEMLDILALFEDALSRYRNILATPTSLQRALTQCRRNESPLNDPYWGRDAWVHCSKVCCEAFHFNQLCDFANPAIQQCRQECEQKRKNLGYAGCSEEYHALPPILKAIHRRAQEGWSLDEMTQLAQTAKEELMR